MFSTTRPYTAVLSLYFVLRRFRRKYEKQLIASSFFSVFTSARLSALNNSVLIVKIFVQFYIRLFFEDLSTKFKFKYEKNNEYLIWRHGTFMIITRSVLLKMRNISSNIVEKIKTHFIFSNFITKIVPFMELCGKNTVQPDRTQTTI